MLPTRPSLNPEPDPSYAIRCTSFVGVDRRYTSVSAIGLPSARERVAATEMRIASRPSPAVQGLAISPPAPRRTSASSERYAASNLVRNVCQAGPENIPLASASHDLIGVRGPRPTATLSADPTASIRTS